MTSITGFKHEERQRIKAARVTWAQLGEVSTNDSGEIETAFMHFSAGTVNTEIWQWIESFYGVEIVEDLMPWIK